MFLLLVWLPLGFIVSTITMFFMRSEFFIVDFDDFIEAAFVWIGIMLFWPAAVIYGILACLYHLFFERRNHVR